MGMNKMLERAFAEAAKLPEDTQEANTQDQLGELVRQAREEVARGDVLPRGVT